MKRWMEKLEAFLELGGVKKTSPAWCFPELHCC